MARGAGAQAGIPHRISRQSLPVAHPDFPSQVQRVCPASARARSATSDEARTQRTSKHATMASRRPEQHCGIRPHPHGGDLRQGGSNGAPPSEKADRSGWISSPPSATLRIKASAVLLGFQSAARRIPQGMHSTHCLCASLRLAPGGLQTQNLRSRTDCSQPLATVTSDSCRSTKAHMRVQCSSPL